MAQRTTLNERQVDVLRWIADGCKDDDFDGISARISAGALRNRDLVRTTGSGPTWKATITKAGREYLARVDGPDPPLPREPNKSVTQQLVDDVIAAGGTLRVPIRTWQDPDRVDYERRAQLAQRYRKVPAGKRLELSSYGDELKIQLVDAPGTDNAEEVELRPVEIPERIARYHPAARAFRDQTGRHEISRDQVTRATRIVHALATEAERRGWTATPPEGTEDRYGNNAWTATKNGHLHIVAGDHVFWLRLHEEGAHTRSPWERDVHNYRNVRADDPWYRDRKLPAGPYDADATGRLKLELFATGYASVSGRQSRWSDRQSWTLEERLPHIIREIAERVIDADHAEEQRRIKAEQAAEAARLAAEERERQWHIHMARAKDRLVESHRATRLRAQADAWETADRLRRYCDAMDETHGHQPETAEWLTWARSYAERIDPLSAPPAMPADPPATKDALQPHLPAGWSADGPQHGRRQRGW